MHELSIAQSIVEIVNEHVKTQGADRVDRITLRVGALSCVHKSALEFSFDLVTKETILSGAKLTFIDVPVTIYCPSCEEEVELPGIQRFRCPTCNTLSGDIRRGKELDIESIELRSSEKVRA